MPGDFFYFHPLHTWWTNGWPGYGSAMKKVKVKNKKLFGGDSDEAQRRMRQVQTVQTAVRPCLLLPPGLDPQACPLAGAQVEALAA